MLLPSAPTGADFRAMESREGLCRRIAHELRTLPPRSIQAIEGDAGSGKTVALIGLAHHLARRGCVPVLVSLRDASIPIDLTTLAKGQFLRDVDHRLTSDSDGDRLWRQLCRSKRLVILAD